MGDFKINGIQQFPMHIITSRIQSVNKILKYIAEFGIKHSLNILNEKESGLLGFDKINVCKKQFPSFIVQSSLLSRDAPRLARRASDKALTFWNIFGVDFVDITQYKLSIGMIFDISITNSRVELICPNHTESCLFKSQIKTSTT